MAGRRPCDSSRRTGAEASRRPWGETLPAFTVRGGLCGTQVRFAGLLDTSAADGHPQVIRTEEHQNDKRPVPTRGGCAQQGIGGDFADDEQRILGNAGPAHPRVRGALLRAKMGPGVRGGPSPRARGSQDRCVTNNLDARSIPACAGLSSRRTEGSFWPPVHPRVRGALTKSSWQGTKSAGPSPRARGSRCGHVEPGKAGRSIPACAGLSANDLRRPRALSSRNIL